MNPQVHAHLDRRIRCNVLCGHPRCDGQLGILIDGFPSGDEAMVLLMPYFWADVLATGAVTWRPSHHQIKARASGFAGGMRRSQHVQAVQVAPRDAVATGQRVRLLPAPPAPYRRHRPVDLPAAVICPTCGTPNRLAAELLLPVERS